MPFQIGQPENENIHRMDAYHRTLCTKIIEFILTTMDAQRIFP